MILFTTTTIAWYDKSQSILGQRALSFHQLPGLEEPTKSGKLPV